MIDRRPEPAPPDAPRFVIVDGRMAMVVPPRPPIIPRTLDLLLGALRNVTRNPVIVGGASIDCGDGRHRLALWLSGTYGALALRLFVCLDCETVEVRDVSLDSIVGAPQGRQGPKRGNELLGWYSGRRPNGRRYY